MPTYHYDYGQFASTDKAHKISGGVCGGAGQVLLGVPPGHAGAPEGTHQVGFMLLLKT